MMLKVTDIHKSYGSLKVLKGVDLEISKREIVSIVGTSGSGKSTLLHVMSALDRPDQGEVELDEKLLFNYSNKDLAKVRNQSIGFIFQFHNLLPEFTALENVCLPGFIGFRKENEVRTRANELLKTLGLAGRADHKPSNLSGGEQQRVSVARALINNPAIIFADEPSGNLDRTNAQALHQLFFRLREELNITFVLVTHNEEFADMADRKLKIQDGKIKAS